MKITKNIVLLITLFLTILPSFGFFRQANRVVKPTNSSFVTPKKQAGRTGRNLTATTWKSSRFYSHPTFATKTQSPNSSFLHHTKAPRITEKITKMPQKPLLPELPSRLDKAYRDIVEKWLVIRAQNPSMSKEGIKNGVAADLAAVEKELVPEFNISTGLVKLAEETVRKKLGIHDSSSWWGSAAAVGLGLGGLYYWNKDTQKESGNNNGKEEELQ